MIDCTDIEPDYQWLNPENGSHTNTKGKEIAEFGKNQIDGLLEACQYKMLPITVELVEELVVIETDWRYKYAGYMAYSQVGEYIEDLTQISGMVPRLVFDMG